MNWMTQSMMWIMLSLAISIALNFLLWPYLGFLTLIPIIGVFLGISYIVRKRAMAKMGMGGQGGGFGGMLGGGGGISYVCIACGHKFKGGACPRCGSKMRRADF
jgi:O-antigen/teichoic acid export membrane protein